MNAEFAEVTRLLLLIYLRIEETSADGGDPWTLTNLMNCRRDFDDLAVTAEELKDESAENHRKKLDEVQKAIESASDTVDEIDDNES